MTIRVRDLGRLDGPILLFGGPYSNLQALRALRDTGDALGIPKERRLCTGDIVAYCGDPVATWDLMQDAFGASVAGNCEKQIASGEEDCGCGFADGSVCDMASRSWFPFAQGALQGHRDALGALPDLIVFECFGNRYAMLHGGMSDVSRYLWPDSHEGDLLQEINLVEREVSTIDAVIAGHCGLAFERVIGGKRWINAGVIGMPPHDGRRDTRYAILAEDGARIARLNYDAEAAAARMRDCGLIQGYERSLGTGIWPSEDILPASLRRTGAD